MMLSFESAFNFYENFLNFYTPYKYNFCNFGINDSFNFGLEIGQSVARFNNQFQNTTCSNLEQQFRPLSSLNSIKNQGTTNVGAKNFNYKKQSLEFENLTRLYCNSSILSTDFQNSKTVYDLLRNAENISNNGSYLGWKPEPNQPYKWLNYSETWRAIKEVGSGLVELGLEPSKDQMVGIFARNRPEWTITEHACNSYSFVSLPLNETFEEETISYILNQTQLRVAACDDCNKAFQLMKSPSHLRVIIIFDNILDQNAIVKATDSNIILITYDRLRDVGRRYYTNPVPPKPNDIFTICYNSDSTRFPKGTILTHENMISAIKLISSAIKKIPNIKNGQEIYFSYLAQANIFERVTQAFILSIGGSIGFHQDGISKIAEGIKELRPTIFFAVPKLLIRFYAQINQIIKSYRFQESLKFNNNKVFEKIVDNYESINRIFKEIRDYFGNRVKIVLTACKCHVIECYGATETCGVSKIQILGETFLNDSHLVSNCSLKLIDVLNLNLVAKRDSKGEILIKGPNVFKGYYKDPDNINGVLDQDGWYHTGDIGFIDKNGHLKIIDKSNHIFKLSQGEYIAPEKIENIYLTSSLISQIFIYGNSSKSSLVAIVVPEETNVFMWAKKNNLEMDMKKLCVNSLLKQTILNDMNQIARNKGLKKFKQVKDAYLHPELFSIQKNLLTSTMRSKRNELKKHFSKEIGDMLKHLE